MRTPIACCLTTALCILVPALALATPDIGQEDNGWSLADERALETYATASKELGPQAVGRNIVEDGWRKQNGKVVPASDAQIETWHNRLKTMLNPPEPATAVGSSAIVASSAPATTSVAPSSGGYASSATVQCESGGDYSINTGNGYYGAYQFDSQTWDAYGDPAYGEAHEAPPAVQDAAAASVPYDAWPNC
jgi:hypothetical protein